MLGNGFVPKHVSIAQESLILLQFFFPSHLPPLLTNGIQFKDLYIARYNLHIVDPIEHILQLLTLHQPLIIG